MNTLIEKLRNNDNPHKIFADMTPEEQECLVQVGPENCDILTGEKGPFWVGNTEPFKCYRGYRIKPNYQPQPEYVDLEIITEWLSGAKHLVVGRPDDMNFVLPHLFTAIHILPSLPGFRGFYVAHSNGGQGFIYLSQVAQFISKGEKVIARIER